MSNKTFLGADGVEYELIDFHEFKEIARNSKPHSQALQWSTSQQYAPMPSGIYWHESLVEKIEATQEEAPIKWALLLAWAPPRVDTTWEDFLTWARTAIAEDRAFHSNNRNHWSHLSRSAFTVNLGFGYAHNTYSRKHLWVADVLADRNKYFEAYSTQRWNSPKEHFISLATKEFSPAKKRVETYLQDILLLNEYLGGRGCEFAGTFGEYLEGAPQELKDEIALYEVKGNEFTNKILSLGSSRTVATFDHTVTIKHRKLLLDQPREVWLELLEQAPKYSKGKSYSHLEELLKEIKADLSGQDAVDYKIYTPSELRREYTLLVAEGVLFEGPYYNPDRLHGLASTALQAIPAEYELVRYAKEYSKLLKLVKDLLAQARSVSELEELIAVEEDVQVNRNAALAQGKLTLQQTVGFLLACFYPQSWLRGSSENAPFLLCEMLETKGLSTLQAVSEVLFEVHDAVPTENEWRRSLSEVDFTMPMGLLLPLIVNGKALESKKRKGYPDIVHLARSYFGIKSHKYGAR